MTHLLDEVMNVLFICLNRAESIVQVLCLQFVRRTGHSVNEGKREARNAGR